MATSKKSDRKRTSAKRAKPVSAGGKRSKPRAKSAPPGNQRGPFIVAIGASAGGLEALEAFFSAMPSDNRFAFVVVTHQHPSHKSSLPTLLAKRTQMPIEIARDQTTLEAGRVYLNPAGKNLAALGGKLQTMELVAGESPHLPIDYFFRSLARDQDDHAICIVLSGTGTDGTLGLRAIKEYSGMVMVQDERSAQHTGMPHSAAATQLADFVLPPDQMPKQLIAYVTTAEKLGTEAPLPEADLANVLPKLFVLVRNRTGHDFSGYKLSTMQRRIERRMKVHELVRPADYLQLLQAQPHEVELLFSELLITVTQFFRDTETIVALQQILTKLVDAQPDEVSLRVWVAGCSTGEEAYSIAMLISEVAERAHKRLQLQIFATDLDPHCIEVARAAIYPHGIATDFDAMRLQRFFVAHEGGYRIAKPIRDCVVFATQNMLRDPPFTKLDMLSCRNVLIYLNPELQQRLFPLFHYALKPGGILWLGTSETAAGFADQFVALDRKARIYERRKTATGAIPLFNLRLSAPAERKPAREPARPVPFTGIGASMERVLLERFVPPTVVVSERGDIAYIQGRTGAYLEPSAGEPRHNLFAMAREGLRLALPSAIRNAARETSEVVHRGVRVGSDGNAEITDVIVKKLEDPESLRGLFRVSFERRPASNGPKGKAAQLRTKNGAHELAIEHELKQTRISLESTIEELRSSNEELKSANEELQSTNEELQSSNEELETSKEELHSLNEELQTVNAELQCNMDELARSNDDMQNLLNGTAIATLFLDSELKIKRFTEQARQVVRLIATDVGRPIGDLVSEVRYEHLTEDAQHVLSTLIPHESEVQTVRGEWLLVRMLPYRTSQNMIDGVVITFVNIDRVKHAEQLAASRALAQSIVQTVRAPLLSLNAELRILSANRAFFHLFGLEEKDVEDRSIFEIDAGALALPRLRELLAKVVAKETNVEDFEFTHVFPKLGRRRVLLNARRLEEVGDATTGCVLVALEHSAPPALS
jgi:two-component system CheB/CheR fusion protein